MNQNSLPAEIKTGFPLWRYLHQPLFHSTTVLNSVLFWHRHRLRVQDPISFLEECWRLNYEDKLGQQSMDSK
jgi:hypothetical protein